MIMEIVLEAEREMARCRVPFRNILGGLSLPYPNLAHS